MRESPAPVLTNDLLTGHHRRGPGYRGWREHGTDDWLLILTLDGEGRFGTVSGVEFTVERGDIVLLRPGTRHDYGIARGAQIWDLLWAHFYPRPAWQEFMRWPEVASGLVLQRLGELPIFDRVSDRFHEAHQFATGDLPLRMSLAMNALEEVLIWCSSQLPMDASRREPRVEAVLNCIRSRLAEKISLANLSACCDLAPSRMSQLFRTEIGMTPIQYIEAERLARAKQLLARTTMPIHSIAAEVGFDNPFYFTLRFKKHNGMAPTAWRSLKSASTVHP